VYQISIQPDRVTVNVVVKTGILSNMTGGSSESVAGSAAENRSATRTATFESLRSREVLKQFDDLRNRVTRRDLVALVADWTMAGPRYQERV